jgi:glycosyltransferase involved in cell wall biosynthesis
MIIRSLALLPDNIPEFQFIFTSAGPLLEGMVGLADRIVPARIREKIVFWKGVSYESILEGLCQSHIFVSMSKSDGTSTALLEALASGLYPILSDIPQNREWVNPIEGNGILIALNSVESLAIALDKCVRQIGNLRKYSHYNIALVNERANARINREHLVKVIEKSISENRGRQ